MKNSKSNNLWLYIIMAIPFIYLAIVWNSMPETIGTHFDVNGEADAFGSKNWLIYLPLFLIGSSFLILKLT